MKLPAKIALVNAAAVIGCVAALFVVPPATSLKLFVSICLGAILVLNLGIFIFPRIRNQKDSAKPRDGFRSVTLWALIFIFLLWEFLLNHTSLLNYVR